MNKRILLIIGSLMLMSVIVSACSSAPSTATPTAVATAAVKTASLSTAAEGNLEPLQTTNLNFTGKGQIAEVLVKEGDTVKAGDVIARLKSDAQRDALTEAEAVLATAKAGQAAYRTQLPQLLAGAQAEIKVAQAQQSGAAAGRDHQAEIVEAEAALAQAKYLRQQAQTGLDMMYEYNKTSGDTFDRVKMAYDNAVQAVQAAEARVKALKAGSPSDRAQGAQITAAQASEAAANARLAQLQAELDGKAADTFEAAIQQAEVAIDSAKIALSQTELLAPFAGTIAQLNLKAGETTPTNLPAVVLADLAGWQIETDDVTEIKVPGIKVGQTVAVKFDALPDVTLKGEVESISSVSQLKSGDVVFPVKVKLLESDPRLRWGMTAAVSFDK
jgi:multidrug efflux pump subunit AcrA (membrane-fusion protein)